MYKLLKLKKEVLEIFGVGPVVERLEGDGDINSLWMSKQRKAKGGPAISKILKLAQAAGVEVQSVDKSLLDKRTKGQNHQGVLIEAPPFEYADLWDVIKNKDGGRVVLLALDGVTDPQNLGAIVRSAYLLGVNAVVLPKDRSAKINGVVLKTSAGAAEQIPVVMVTNLTRALQDPKDEGFWNAAICGGESATDIRNADKSGNLCLVMGAEGEGLRPGVLKSCDYTWEIPMFKDGVGSFNVSVAAAIVLFEVVGRG